MRLFYKKVFTRSVGFDIPLDRGLLARINRDMEENGGTHRPNLRWQMSSLFEDAAKQLEPSFKDMLPAWLGRANEEVPSKATVGEHVRYLAPYDHLGLMAHYETEIAEANASALITADLRSIQDVTLITRYLPPETEKVRILEIGGGYGRLAEAFFSMFGGQVSYVLTDAVPVSIYYCYEYLRRNLPWLRVGLYLDDAYGPDAFDCYIVPVWHVDRVLGGQNFDIGINVASMQETEDAVVASCIDLFDRRIRTGGVIYLNNSRDFIYVRDYDYPKTWRLHIKEQCPRSITPHYPVEVFTKDDVDCSADNAAVDLAYRRDLDLRFGRLIAQLQAAKKQQAAAYAQVRTRLKTKLEQMARNRDKLQEKMMAERQTRKFRFAQLQAAKKQQAAAYAQVRTRLKTKLEQMARNRDKLQEKMMAERQTRGKFRSALQAYKKAPSADR